jgi:hypothetical protein
MVKVVRSRKLRTAFQMRKEVAMKFAICNEVFGDRQFADTFSTIRKLGHSRVEIARFKM